MRLTLRTLLSWKDGMLEADAASDLAARVAASQDAQRLIERINEVSARPTLAAPPADATAFVSAANTTAEYLDNVLPAARLADFERVCYTSDTQLAETAATHELLAELCRKPPAPLDAATRRRLLAAVNARETGGGRPRRVVGGDADAAGHPQELEVPRPADRDERVGDERPHRKAGAPFSAWLLVVAALLLLAVLVGVLGWSLTKGPPKPVERRDVADRPAAATDKDAPAGPAAVADAVAAEPAPGDRAAPAAVDAPTAPADTGAPPAAADAGANAVAPPPPMVAAAGAGTPVAAGEPQESAGELHVAVTVPAPASATPAAGAGDVRVPQGDALAIAAVAPVQPAPVQPPVAGPVDPAAAVVDGLVAHVEGAHVVLFRPVDDRDQPWLAAGRGARLDLPIDLVAPPFCRSELVIGGVRITLEPGTRAAVRRDLDGVPCLDLVFGSAMAAGEGPLGLSAGALAGVVSIGPAAPVTVDVKLDRPRGAPADSTARVARIGCVASPLAWRQTAADGAARAAPFAGMPADATIPAGHGLVWRSTAPDVVTIEADPPSPAAAPGRGPDDSIARRAAESLARRCVAGTAALPTTRELAGARSEDRMAAAAALAMIGDFDELANLLLPGTAPDGTDAGWAGHWQWLWSRLDEAVVQPALARGPRAAEALARALEARALAVGAPADTARTIVRLARGFTDEEFAAGGDEELVAALESPHLVIRRYAIANLVALTGTDGGYSAERPVEASRKEITAWRKRLEQGRMVPNAAGAKR